MKREQALNQIIELSYKWQQKHEWAAAFKAADRFREYRDKCTERFDELADNRHSQVVAAHGDFIAMENLLREHAPKLLALVPSVNFFTDSANDHSQQILDVRTLEGEVRAMLKIVPPTVENAWVHRRESLNETVEDQMAVLYKEDPRTAAMFSSEIAEILGCSEAAVRKSDNKVWQMFKAEKEAAKKKLKRRDTSDNLDGIDDE
jgi:hypothetical protein